VIEHDIFRTRREHLQETDFEEASETDDAPATAHESGTNQEEISEDVVASMQTETELGERSATQNDAEVDDHGSMDDNTVNSKGAPSETASVISTATDDLFSPMWIKREAVDLLGRIQQHTTNENASTNGNRYIISGYGFGGLVVKQVNILPCSLTLSFEHANSSRLSFSLIRTPSSTMLR
jgi:hypothetical protein